MPKWLLPTVSEVVALSDPAWSRVVGGSAGDGQAIADDRSGQRAQREWDGAIAALEAMLYSKELANADSQAAGVIISGPLPVLNPPEMRADFSTWALTAHRLDLPFWLPMQLLPAAEKLAVVDDTLPPVLSLLPGDPLAEEQFCLVLTPGFSVVMVRGKPWPNKTIGKTISKTGIDKTGIDKTAPPAFMFSFLPDVVERVWEVLRPRILLTSPQHMGALDEAMQRFPPVVPDYHTVMQFSRLMLAHLPAVAAGISDREMLAADKTSRLEDTAVPPPRFDLAPDVSSPDVSPPDVFSPDVFSPDVSPPHLPSLDVELLQAIAHEIRTPLTTIRTLTRSLLKRQDLHADVVKRLGMIDRECSEQIDRFGLIFRAVELETTSAKTAPASLTRTFLDQVFADSIPRWQHQASQRNLTLEVTLPQRTPTVVSDPSMLDKALTSLLERFTRSLPTGSHIWVEVTPAGNQLKVQLRSQTPADPAKSAPCRKSKLRSLGQVLMFQPETGSLSLNMAVTKNLFQALGGKLIVRQRPEQGEVMTIFLPLEKNNPEKSSTEKSPSSLLDNATILDA